MAAILQHPTAYGATGDDWAHFDLVLGLTEDLLPVVSNPKAVISPDSKMKDLGKTPSVYNSRRHVAGFPAWTQHHASADELARWSRERDYGICLQTRRVRAIDVDVSDVELAQRIHEFLHDHWGYAPWRSRSNAANFLLAFEMPGEFTKRKFKTAHGIVEFLATGQQFIAVGTHPSGVRYQWDGGELPDALPRIAPALFEEVWARLVEAFGLEEAARSTASVKGEKLTGAIIDDPVAQFLLSIDRVKRTERDGRMHIVCPFEAEHTSDSGDSATTYFPAHTGGYVNGHFQCLHAHCEHRSDQEFLDAIEYSAPDLAGEFEAIGEQDRGRPAATTAANGEAAAVGGAGNSSPDVEAPAARFRFIPAHEFAVGTPPAWMVKGVLPAAQLAVLFGESGSGKTFAALDMAVAVATGSLWRGRLVRQGRVAYIAAEGAGGFRNRLKAIAQHRQLQLEQVPITVLADAPNLMEKSDALDIARAIVVAGGAQLVIVDTFAQVMPGANENAGEDVGRALAHCRGIHRATGALVMLVHHSGKDASRGARGWSGLRAAADVELEVVRADNERSLAVTKMKDGDDGTEFGFRLETVMVGFDEDGEEVTSCVVEHTDGTSVRAIAAAAQQGPKGAVERLVMMQLEELIGLGSELVHVNDLLTSVCAQMPHDPNDGKRDRRNFRAHRALEGLVAAGRVRIADGKVGPA